MKRPRPQPSVLLRTTAAGEFQLLDAASNLPLVTLPNRRAVDSYLTMNALRVVATPASSPQGAAQAADAPAAPGAADTAATPPCPTVRALRQGEP